MFKTTYDETDNTIQISNKEFLKQWLKAKLEGLFCCDNQCQTRECFRHLYIRNWVCQFEL